jgi:nucleotide-binding universal stress UspA family protein
VKRILVAVDDSPPAIAAATNAIELAVALDAQLHFVAVAEADRDSSTALRHVERLAEQAGLEPVSTTADGGHPFEVLLRLADEWHADLVVMGCSDKRRPGVPYVGSQTEHLLEFTHIPVLVVPHRTARHRPRRTSEPHR